MFRRAPICFYTGVVSSWKKGSPYGFIKDTDSGANYFLHRDDIVDANRNGVKSLPEGFRIEFDKAVFEGRTKAVAVTLRGGAPITSTGEERDNDRRRSRRDDDDDHDNDRRRSRRDDDDDRDYERSRRDEEARLRKITASYDRELSRIQGSLAALARASVSSFGNARTNYHGLVSLAGSKNVVVPSLRDETAKEANAKRWADYKEKTQELREDAKERRAERRANLRNERVNEEAETPKTKRSSTVDAEDMF